MLLCFVFACVEISKSYESTRLFYENTILELNSSFVCITINDFGPKWGNLLKATKIRLLSSLFLFATKEAFIQMYIVNLQRNSYRYLFDRNYLSSMKRGWLPFLYLEVVIGSNGVVISNLEEKLISNHFLTLGFLLVAQTTLATLVSSSLNFVRKCQLFSFENFQWRISNWNYRFSFWN